MARLNLIERKNSKKVCFNTEITIKEIPSHREWTPSERLSRYNTDDDYRQFKIRENQECFNGPPSSKAERMERIRRIKDVRYLVIRAQHVQRKIAKNNNCCSNNKKQQKKEDHSKWLAEFYRHYSEKCTIAARQRGLENDLWLQRGLENDLWLLGTELKEVSSILFQYYALSNHLTLSHNNGNNNKNNNNSLADINKRCSAIERGNSYMNNKRSAVSSFNDSPPNGVESSRKLRKVLLA